MFKKAILVFAFMAVVAAPGWALVRVSPVGVLSTTDVKSNDPVKSYSSRLGFGGGALLEVNFPGSSFGLELGGLYYERKFQRSVNMTVPILGPIVAQSDISHQVLQLPLTLRYRFLSLFSLGLGGYYTKYLGDAKIETRTALVGSPFTGSTVTNASYSELGTKSYDAGVLASLGVEIPFSPLIALRLEGRYNKGLVNASKDSSQNYTSKVDAIQGLAGFTLGF